MVSEDWGLRRYSAIIVELMARKDMIESSSSVIVHSWRRPWCTGSYPSWSPFDGIKNPSSQRSGSIDRINWQWCPLTVTIDPACKLYSLHVKRIVGSLVFIDCWVRNVQRNCDGNSPTVCILLSYIKSTKQEKKWWKMSVMDNLYST